MNSDPGSAGKWVGWSLLARFEVHLASVAGCKWDSRYVGLVRRKNGVCAQIAPFLRFETPDAPLLWPKLAPCLTHSGTVHVLPARN